MADDQGGGRGAGDLALQGLDRKDIQMVGRLVEQDQVGLFRERLGERRPPRLASGQALRRLLRIEPEGLERGVGHIALRAPGRGVVTDRRPGDLRLLQHHGDTNAGLQEAVAGVGLHQAGQDAQKGRLAGPVAPDEAGPHAGLQAQVDAVEQGGRTIGEAHILQRRQGRTAGRFRFRRRRRFHRHGWIASAGRGREWRRQVIGVS
jgi:hypothetical protein